MVIHQQKLPLKLYCDLAIFLSAEKDKTETVKSIALGLVRNIEYRKTIFDSENPGGTPVIDGQGNYHYPMPSSKSYEETQKIE